MSDLLAKFLDHYDPVHRGWTPSGIAHGTQAMNGVCVARVEGGYNLVRGTSRTTIDMDNPVGAAGHDATEIEPFPGTPHLPNTNYYYRLVPVGPGGVAAVERGTDPQVALVRSGADGTVTDPQPPAPRNLVATATTGGKIRVSCSYQPSDHYAAAASLRVYHDNGTGTMDWTTPIRTITVRTGAAGSGLYSVETAAYTHGTTVMFGIRARTAAATEEVNTVTASAVADAEGPDVAAIEDAEYGDDE